jgi:hypothetical protein
MINIINFFKISVKQNFLKIIHNDDLIVFSNIHVYILFNHSF